MVIVLLVGRFFIKKFDILRKFDIPEPVVGGIIAAVIIPYNTTITVMIRPRNVTATMSPKPTVVDATKQYHKPSVKREIFGSHKASTTAAMHMIAI